MEIEAIKKIMSFLKEKENKSSLKWRVINGEQLKVIGDLDFSNAKITSLPKGLKVSGDLRLFNTNIISLPEGLKVGGDLWCVHNTTKELPKDLYVGGDLFLYYSLYLEKLPKGLQVEGDIIIYDTYLENYTDEDLLKMIEPTGFINGKIVRE